MGIAVLSNIFDDLPRFPPKIKRSKYAISDSQTEQQSEITQPESTHRRLCGIVSDQIHVGQRREYRNTRDESVGHMPPLIRDFKSFSKARDTDEKHQRPKSDCSTFPYE